MRVFVTGGTGLVGARLIRALVKRGDAVVVLSRRAEAWERVGQDVTIVTGDPTEPGPWQDELAKCDAVVNLVGAGIFDKRWSAAYKKTIRDSRVKSANNVVDALKRPDATAKVLVNASAIGYYGPHDDEEITEANGLAGRDFMAGVCVEWEQAAQAATVAGVRVVMGRIGIVHDHLGGALSKLMLPFRLGIGGPVGMSFSPSMWGKQYWSWIHYADLVGLFLMALDTPAASGPINFTAPHPVTNKQFATAFGAALGRPAFAPVPAIGLRVLLGGVSEIITTGQRVIPAKALALGYRYQFPEIGPALRDLIKGDAIAA